VSLALRFAARSHTGLLREGNEDSVYAGPRVLAVADGMGGHAAGEVASAVAIAALAHLDEDAPGGDLLDLLQRSAVSANDHLRDMVAGDPALDGMGTTLTAFLFAGSRIGVLHVGDSRAYLLRDGELSQITHDHTLVQTLVDEGRISEEEASSHPQRSLITRALDGREGIEPDLSVREVRPGDRYLLCTDGLTGPVGRLETLQEALAIPDPQESCDRLVQLALRGGGPDNVTVVVADVVEARGGGTSAPVVGGAAADSPQPPPEGVDDSAAARARTAEGRAAKADSTPARTVPAAEARPRRRLGRTAALTALVVGLLLAGAGAGYGYVRSQYYVGVDDGHVAIFRGVTGSVAGLRLSGLERRTDLGTERLDRLAVSRVEQGIVAADRRDAERIVEVLESTFPQCLATAVPTPRVETLPTAATAVPSPPVGTPSPAAAPALPTPAAAQTAPSTAPAASPSPLRSAPALDAPCPQGAR
jgi:serine/threonine protein phosphatase PrpC